MTTEKATYDTVRVAQGTDTWFGDTEAVILAQWTLSVPVEVKTDVFSLPSTITLEKSEEFDSFVWYNILGANSYYSYMLEEIGIWGGGHFPGEVPDAQEYTLSFTTDSGATSFLLYGFDFIVDEDDCIMYVSKPMELTVNSGDMEADYAVSNIHFEMFGGTPDLFWDVPASAVSGMSYIVSFSADGGDTWKIHGGTRQNLMNLMGLESGTYNAVKVETEVENQIVAECVATDLTFVMTQGADLPYAPVTAALDSNGRYDFTVSGLTPDVYCRFTLQGTECHSASSSMVGSDGIYTHDNETSAYVEALLAENASYLVQEFTNGTVSADGKSASMTVRDRGGWVKLSTLLGGSEETTVSGTVSGGSGASITIGGESVQVNEDGSFVLPAEGEFDVVITKGGCLTYTIKGVSTANGSVELPEVVMVAGDVNEDDKINIADMGVFRQEFGKTGSAIGNAYTDVNNDGKVNIADMGVFRQNFGKTAEKDCTVTYQ